MNKKYSKHILFPVLFGLALALSGPVPAAPPDAGAATVDWYEGPLRRRVWLRPELLAEIGPTPGAGQATVVDRGARLVAATGQVRLFRLADHRLSVRLARGEDLPAAGGVRYAPVFSSSPGGGVRSTLPGGVLVAFEAGWTDADARRWAGAHGLVITRELPVRGNMYLLATEPGFASLHLAERLRQSPGVRLAVPNWWQERAPN